MKLPILVISLFILISCGKKYGQESTKSVPPVRPEILKLVSKIAADSMLVSASVGIMSEPTDQWRRYELLNQDATNDELEILSNNNNSVVRCYAFQALASRKIDVFPILLQHLADTAHVETLMGCTRSSEKTGDYFIDVITPEYIGSGYYKLTKQQQIILDSILINDSTVKLYKKESLLEVIKPNPIFYQQIRHQAEAGSPQATLALARFEKEADITIIRNLFLNNEGNSYYAIYCAREFPTPEFYPYLARIFKNEWRKKLYDYPKWRILYQALAKYPTDETYTLFEKTIYTKNSFRKQTLGAYLLLALRKYPNPKFAPLIKKIKLDDFHLNEALAESNVEE